MPKPTTFQDLIGKSPSFLAAVDTAKRVAKFDVSVLLFGEPGTGKELFARAIHHASKRKGGNFVPINCAALTNDLVESELFGYIPGAFTGADKKGKEGLFRTAHEGTLFLDEVATMPLIAQAKILRAIEEKVAKPLGSNKEIETDFRLISATNEDLRELICKGTIRKDLFYRLDVARVCIPALRKRREDIPLLTKHFLGSFCEEERLGKKKFSKEAMERLYKYDWPGNIRELRSECQRAVVNSQSNVIENANPGQNQKVKDLRVLSGEVEREMCNLVVEYRLSMKEIQRILIDNILEQCGGNKAETARLLGISRSKVHRWKTAPRKLTAKRSMSQ
jgi:transcriptional regulator with PAS, ATPase and Fis domain